MQVHQLNKKIIIKGKIIAETGLMIGSNNAAMDIGGTDKQVIRNPLNDIPYIPGSSLKGKMRSQFEISRGQVDEKGGPTQNPKHESARLFGHINQNEDKKQQPSRLIVRDGAMLNKDDFPNTELLYTEIKAENTISRVTAEANPRFFERVPAGAKFEMNMALNIFNTDVDGSRGNGQISFQIEKVIERSPEYYQNEGAGEIDITNKVPTALKA